MTNIKATKMKKHYSIITKETVMKMTVTLRKFIHFGEPSGPDVKNLLHFIMNI